MFVAWIVFHVIVCIALILVVLMQSSKGEGLAGSAFSGGLSSAVFGGRGAASFLSKATTVLAVLFMLNCGALALMSSKTTTTAGGATTPQTQGQSAVTKEAQAEVQREQQQQQKQNPNQQGLPEGTPTQVNPNPPAQGGGNTGGTQTPPSGGTGK